MGGGRGHIKFCCSECLSGVETAVSAPARVLRLCGIVGNVGQQSAGESGDGEEGEKVKG